MKWDIDLWQNIQLEKKGQQSDQKRKRNNKKREINQQEHMDTYRKYEQRKTDH